MEKPTLRGRLVAALSPTPIGMVLANPLFDRAWYEQRYPDVRGFRGGAWLHWRRHGWREWRDPNPWFHTSWYLTHYPDVQATGMDPLLHYLRHGAREGRRPRRDATPR